MEDEILKKLAQKIKCLREAKGLSQEDLALKAGVDRTYIGRIERAERNPSFKSLHKIASALDIKLSELVNME